MNMPGFACAAAEKFARGLPFKTVRWLMPAVLGASLLAACGGGDDGLPAPAPASQTLSGVAAVGLPIAGATVNISCSAGSAFSATTGSAGEWTVSTSGQTLPCAVQVSGGTVAGVANANSYQSIAMAFGNVNVTPLTSLVVAQLLGSDPAAWFRSPVFTRVSGTAIDAAIAAVSTSLGMSSTLGTINPLTASFKAENGDRMDDILEALALALKDRAKTFAELLAAASSGSYSGFPNFGSSFTGSYTIVANGGSGGSGGTTGCSTGQIQMVFSGGGAGIYTNGQKVCFAASASSLAFSGKTLSNPVQNPAVSAPYAAYKFSDAGGISYEVILNLGAMHEINLMNGTTFAGQFTPVATGGTGGTGTGGGTGSYKLLVEVVAAGVGATPVTITGVAKPGNQSEFCGNISGDSSLTALTASGGSLTINSCTFDGTVGTVSATVRTTVPVAISIAYTVRYTYSN